MSAQQRFTLWLRLIGGWTLMVAMLLVGFAAVFNFSQ